MSDLQAEDPTIAEMLKPLGYATGQFGKNHLGDHESFLPTVHGFDEFFGNLYHLNAEEEPELPDYPTDPAFKARFGPRGDAQLRCTRPTTRWGKVGKQKIENTGPLTIKRMGTIDDEITEGRPGLYRKGSTRRTNPSSSGTTPRPCTSVPTLPKRLWARAAQGDLCRSDGRARRARSA